jgi:hypothetical protein
MGDTSAGCLSPGENDPDRADDANFFDAAERGVSVFAVHHCGCAGFRSALRLLHP